MGASLLAQAKSIYYRLNTQEDNSSEETQQASQPCHISQPIIDHVAKGAIHCFIENHTTINVQESNPEQGSIPLTTSNRLHNNFRMI